MSESESLRLDRVAAELARQHGQPAVVVVRPPPGAASGTAASIPYVTLASEATAEELASPGARRFGPGGREDAP